MDIPQVRSRLQIYTIAGALGMLLGTVLSSNGLAMGSESPNAPFKDSSLEEWKERSFSGHSQYELVDVDGTRVLRASTDGAASILYKEKTIELTKTPIITWSWKVQGVYDNINEQTKDGDDFPARLYVVAKTGLLPWQTLAINYVWSSHLEVGQSWYNPYTNKAKMVAVQAGASNSGQWITQSRNIAADFKEHFGKNIKAISGYAIMVDGDNANKKGTAWFADISFDAE